MVLDPGRAGGRYPVTPVSADDPLVVTLLGRIALRRDSTLVDVPGNRARSLLAALALRPGRTRSAAALIEEVWGDEPPRSPANALHTQISRLRSALPDGVLEAGPGGYRLALRADQVDLTAVRELARQARAQLTAGEVEAAQRCIDRARALWSGEPGADLPAGLLADELSAAAVAQDEVLDEVERETRAAAGDHDGAIVVARRQLRRRPTAEAVAHSLMRLLATVGRDSEALAVFADLRAVLATELGTDPGAAITELNTAVLRGRFAPRQTPPASGTGAADQVPSAVGVRAAPNALLGRADDLAELSRLLRVSRVTTVLGPGGAGKTRVANELAMQEAGNKPVVLVELASVRSGGVTAAGVVDIESAIAGAMGLGEVRREPGLLPPISRPDIRRRLRDALSARPMLLVLDNCEHLIEAAAAVVADLVGSCPQLIVLTTSRAPLAITAETVYPLGPLASDAAGSPATELFTARARAVRPSVRLDMEVVARLCRTLDGLPLAIELAAARVRTMSVEDIERRLDQRFALLRSGDRTSPERHRTLHAVIAWSWNLLAPDEQVTLRRMCRFPGGFTLAAAEAVAGGSTVGHPPASADAGAISAADGATSVSDIAAALDGLVGQSLLTVVETEGVGLRYRMLETVREFGEQELVAADTGRGAEIDLVETRMARWARDFAVLMAECYGGGDELRPALTVAVELDNLVTVLRRAESAGDSQTMYAVFPVAAMRWVMHGANLELMGWIPRMLAMAPPVASRGVYAELESACHAVIALHLAFMDRSLRQLALVRSRARLLLRGDTGLRAPFRFLAQLLTCRPDSLGLARLLARATRSPDRHTRSLALMARTNIWENMGRIHESSRDARAAVPTLTEAEVWSRAMLAQHRGSLAGQVARYRESVAFYEEAAELLHRIRAYEESLEVHSYLAASLAGSGEPARARRELATALGFSGSGGADPAVVDDPGFHRNHRLSTIAAVLAGIELVEGEIDAGLRHFRRALELIGWPVHETTPGPGLLLTGSAALAAHVLYERGDVVARLVPELVDLAPRRFGHVLDLPQLGAVACAVGSGLLMLGEHEAAGVELLALAPRVVSRQDYPVLRWDRHRDLWRDRIGVDRLAAAVAAAGGLRRVAAAERILELVREVGAQLPDPLARPAVG
ncbi:BTAD domain-containing putative transcriptional regulator [Nocardia carnea]|uniref:BTAD domain-containing putative transcriptional regulator n=1 Tax=Nocardia carnea TaxID=37328 RepID=A0ABW7TUX1_9NOCA|nr:BTAD domain-containing putative transcriptional regulator [Nocardia carnea]